MSVVIRRSFFNRFSRVTSSGRFIPEIDGLRFVAIALVVLFHLAVNAEIKNPRAYARPRSNLLATTAFDGSFGVQLFFVISGFILAMPFANHYASGANRVRIKRYLLRRVTRLEPPYIISMIVFFGVLVIVRGADTRLLFPHLLASLTYTHNIIYSSESPINNVAWSLEIEIQFYLLVPMVAGIYAIRRAALRRLTVVALIVFGSVVSSMAIRVGSRPFYSILNFYPYFLVGFLLLDLHIAGTLRRTRSRLHWDAVTLLGWPLLIALLATSASSEAQRNETVRVFIAVILPFLVLTLYIAAFRGKLTNGAFTSRWVTTIGGMCYSIYLIHNPILNMVLGLTSRVAITGSYTINYILLFLISIAPVIAAVGVFFLLIEKPCMRPGWPSELLASLRPRTSGSLGGTTLGGPSAPGAVGESLDNRSRPS